MLQIDICKEILKRTYKYKIKKKQYYYLNLNKQKHVPKEIYFYRNFVTTKLYNRKKEDLV